MTTEHTTTEPTAIPQGPGLIVSARRAAAKVAALLDRIDGEILEREGYAARCAGPDAARQLDLAANAAEATAADAEAEAEGLRRLAALAAEAHGVTASDAIAALRTKGIDPTDPVEHSEAVAASHALHVARLAEQAAVGAATARRLATAARIRARTAAVGAASFVAATSTVTPTL